ncbi:Glutathione S-transferase zeta class [Vitis vinifera]|uniref:glutathione transferase n=1 Tax=Vitis vinifera TaxID=29760 RepID=A0A438E098_VITVI|nr:Glutathione S-transferase zeta class [Vitis vinifera]
MSSSSKLVLYSYWQSSCAWRVRFALNLKGLAYEYRSVNLRKGEQFSPEFKKLNPLCFVPVLVDGDIVVSDSFAILLYLNEKYPQNALLPSDPQLRALNLQASNIVSSSMQPLIMQSILKYIEDKFGPAERQLWVRHNTEKGFQALEKLLKDYAGTYATGEEVYMADVFLAPQTAVAEMRFNIDMADLVPSTPTHTNPCRVDMNTLGEVGDSSKFPTLNGIYKSCKDLPEFQASVPERQPDAEL